MVNQELIDYINRQIGSGRNRSDITESLMSSGWSTDDINDAFLHVIISKDTIAPTLFGPVDLLRNSWHLYKQKFKTYSGIVIVSKFISLVSVGLVIASLKLSSLGFTSSIKTLTLILLIITLVASVITVLVMQTWEPIALIYAIAGRNEGVGIKEAFRKGRHKIISYWWLTFLTNMIIASGYFFFIIPGIIFLVYFSAAPYILMMEDVKGMNAILKSREYIKGRWLQVCWRLLFLFLFIILIGFISMLVPIIFMFILNPSTIVTAVGDIFEIIKSAPPLKYIIDIFASIILTSLISIYFFLLYTNLRSVKGPFVFIPSKRAKILLVLFIIIPSAIIILLPGFIVYKTLSSLSYTKPTALHDSIRQSDSDRIQKELDKYYLRNNFYPNDLNELVSKYSLLDIPLDPKINQPYEYKAEEGSTSYQLCIKYDSKGRVCITPVPQPTAFFTPPPVTNASASAELQDGNNASTRYISLVTNINNHARNGGKNSLYNMNFKSADEVFGINWDQERLFWLAQLDLMSPANDYKNLCDDVNQDLEIRCGQIKKGMEKLWDYSVTLSLEQKNSNAAKPLANEEISRIGNSYLDTLRSITGEE